MEFLRYASQMASYAIPNKVLNSPDAVYASEKLDGSNFSIYYDGEDFKYAKRTGFITEADELFGWKNYLTEDTLNSVKAFYVVLVSRGYIKDDGYIVVVGEYFGENVRAKYRNEGKFTFFDVFIKNDTEEFERLSGEEFWLISDIVCLDTPFWIHYPNIRAALKDLPITYDEIFELEYDIFMESYSPETFEGWCIRPVKGNAFFGVKHKTELFAEKSPEKARAMANSVTPGSDLIPYLTVRRIENVLSHGDLKVSDGKKLIDAVIDDALKESGLTETPNRNIYYQELFPLLKGLK